MTLKTAFFDNLTPKNWPLISPLLKGSFIQAVDVIFAKMLLPKASSCEACVLVYLFFLSRQGHLCGFFYPDSGQVLPEPEKVFLQAKLQEEGELSQEGFEAFKQALLKGFQALIKRDDFQNLPLYKEGNKLYLKKYGELEDLAFLHLKLFSRCQPQPQLPTDFFNEALCSSNPLSEEQKQALVLSVNAPLSIISGGPGTGKTFLAGQLISLIQHYCYLQKQNLSIALCAPTGKATQHLRKLISSESSPYLSLTFETLHALLKENDYQDKKKSILFPLPYDLILLDESSMVDLERFSLLLRSLSQTTRLILLGDPYQLPPVESGAFFKDILTLCKTFHFPHHHLKTCYRAESKNIVKLAQFIKEGNFPSLLAFKSRHPSFFVDFSFQPAELKAFYQLCGSFYLQSLPDSFTFNEALDFFKKYKILIPLRKGPFGLENCNKELKKQLFPLLKGKNFHFLPIILKKNSPQMPLFNGETGIFIYLNHENQYDSAPNFAIFEKDNGEILKVPQALLPPFEEAFCLSVHKTQGSEYPHVLIPLPPGSELFGREILYTAVTRAKKSLQIVAEEMPLKSLLARQEKRISGIEDKINNSPKRSTHRAF